LWSTDDGFHEVAQHARAMPGHGPPGDEVRAASATVIGVRGRAALTPLRERRAAMAAVSVTTALSSGYVQRREQLPVLRQVPISKVLAEGAPPGVAPEPLGLGWIPEQ